MVQNNVYLDNARLEIQEKVAEACVQLAKEFVKASAGPDFDEAEKKQTNELAMLLAAAAGMLGGIARQARNWEAKQGKSAQPAGENLTSLDV